MTREADSPADLLRLLAAHPAIAALPAELRAELDSLASEPNSEIFFESLAALGRRLENAGRTEAAQEIDAAILQGRGPQPSAARQRAQAQQRLDAIAGTGDALLRAEFLGRYLAREASDPAAILGMVGAGLAFRLTRLAALSRLNALPSGSFTPNLLGARSFANLAGFAAEVPAFTAATRLGNGLLGREQGWSPEALGRELASGAIVLGCLKVSGAVFGSFVRHQRVEQNAALQSLFSQTGMFVGILGGHRLEEVVGLRPHLDGATTLTDSLATLIQFNLGGRLARGVSGERVHAWERVLDLQSERLSFLPAADMDRGSADREGIVVTLRIRGEPSRNVTGMLGWGRINNQGLPGIRHFRVLKEFRQGSEKFVELVPLAGEAQQFIARLGSGIVSPLKPGMEVSFIPAIQGGSGGSIFFRPKGRAADWGQAELGFDPEAQRRAQVRRYLIQLGEAGMSRGHLAVLDQLSAKDDLNLVELGHLTKGQLEVGESSRSAKELEEVGLIRGGMDLRRSGHPTYRFVITDLGRQLHGLFSPIELRLMLSPLRRRLLHDLGSHRFLGEARLFAEHQDIEEARLRSELAIMENQGLLKRQRVSGYPVTYRYRLDTFGKELHAKMARQLRFLEQILAGS